MTVLTALRGADATSRRLVVVGVLVLLVAVAVVFGLHLASVRPSAQPQTVPASAYGQLSGPAARTVPAASGELLL